MKKRIEIGTLSLKPGRPLIVGVVADLLWEKSAWKLADLFEIRFDHLWSLPGEKGIPYRKEESGQFLRQVKARSKRPVILTIRRPEENDSNSFPESLSDEKRLPFFECLTPTADAVDIEVDSSIAHKVITIAARSKKPVIASYHNFRRLPPESTLYEKLQKANNLGADIFKVAVPVETTEDAVRLLSFCHTFSRRHIISTVGMGKNSLIFRVVSPLFGSVFTYGFLVTTTAPGQPDVKTLSDLYRRFY